MPTISSVLRAECIGDEVGHAHTCDTHTRGHARAVSSKTFPLHLALFPARAPREETTKRWQGDASRETSPRLRRCRERRARADSLFFSPPPPPPPIALPLARDMEVTSDLLPAATSRKGAPLQSTVFAILLSLKFHSGNLTHLLNFKSY